MTANMPPELGISVNTVGDVVVLEVIGELDVSTAPLLREKLIEQFSADQACIVVDLTAVPFMDSTALGVLVGAQKRAAAKSGWLRLVAPHERLRRMLVTTGLDRVMLVYETVSEALPEPPMS